MNAGAGALVISLDFELYWGVRDKRTIEQYKQNLCGVWRAIPEILAAFEKHGVHATWAAVGFLFFKDRAELNANLPDLLPAYKKKHLSPYEYINAAPDLDPVYHFAPALVKLIAEHNGQEIGTHTFSHYYCLEAGQSLVQFEKDIEAAIEVSSRLGLLIRSLVFPRNQWNEEYLACLTNLGIECFRGNEDSWLYRASDDEGQSIVRRAFRLTDAYLNLSGHHTYSLAHCSPRKPFNIPSSRFLRPHSKRLAFLERLRLRRITKAMTHAAKHGEIFHLWWHPHNFGVNTAENIYFLGEILEHYRALRNSYGMRSLNMSEVCRLAEGRNGQ